MDKFEEIFNDVKKSFKRTNILVLGKTGVGKSTLINAIFGEDLAKTGTGKPCTENIKEYSKENFPIHLIDTKGLELETYNEILSDLLEEIKKRKRNPDSDSYIHIAWYCINYGSKRIEDGELNIIKELSSEIPVIVVLTQSTDSNLDFYNEVNNLCYNYSDVLRVLALPYNCPLGTIQSLGLKELISKTTEKMPEAHKAAFISAQKVSLDIKEKHANKYVKGAAIAAAAAGATPIPFSDVAILAPIQIGMLASISLVMGLDITRSFLSTLVSSAAGVAGATYAGKAIVSGLIKLIPGAGSIIGGIISGTTAATLTTTMGYAYIKTLRYLIENDLDMSPDSISTTFINELKNSTLVLKEDVN